MAGSPGSSTPKKLTRARSCAWHLCTYKDRKTLWSRLKFQSDAALKENGIYVVLLVLLMIIVIKEPSFLSLTNLSNILTSLGGSSSPSGWRASSSPRVRICRPVARSAWRAHRGDHAAGADQRQQGVPSLGVPIPAVILLVCVVGP
jgi:methyl-galactoside transport system permease protein